MTDQLREVQDAAIHVHAARAALERAVFEARLAGHSLRAIADRAGLSHEQVRRMSTPDDVSERATDAPGRE